MTPIDLRIKYKSETGLTPTHGKDVSKCCNYKGGLTCEYAEWLEDGFTQRRIFYKFDTGLNATYYKNYLIRYTKGYKEWLERKRCLVLTILEKIRDPNIIVPYIFNNESY